MARVPKDGCWVYGDTILNILPGKSKFSGARWYLYSVREKGGTGLYAVHKQGNMEGRLGGAIAGRGRELAGSVLLKRGCVLDLVLTDTVELRKTLYCCVFILNGQLLFNVYWSQGCSPKDSDHTA